MSYWRPIETAPRNGNPCDVWMQVRDEPDFAGQRWPDVYWDDVQGMWFTYGGPLNPDIWKATHWMPLPNPPEAANTEGEQP